MRILARSRSAWPRLPSLFDRRLRWTTPSRSRQRPTAATAATRAPSSSVARTSPRARSWPRSTRAARERRATTSQTKLVTTRDVYLPELGKGNVDIVPDYLAGITDFLNTEANGPDAELVSSNDPDATLAALKPLAEAKGISILPPSQATDQNAFFVTQEFADENNLATLSDLAALGEPIKLGAPRRTARAAPTARAG